MTECTKCHNPMDMVPDPFAPHMQCRVCGKIVYLTMDGKVLESPTICNSGQHRKYKDVRPHVERLIDADYTTAEIARILDMPSHTIYKGARDYRIKVGKFSFTKSRHGAGVGV